MSMMDTAGLPPAAGIAPGAPLLPPGAGMPPAAPVGPAFPSLDPATMAQMLAPATQLQAADIARLKAQQQQLTGSLIDMMNAQPNPAAEAAMVEPGAPSSPLAPANSQVGGQGLGLAGGQGY